MPSDFGRVPTAKAHSLFDFVQSGVNSGNTDLTIDLTGVGAGNLLVAFVKWEGASGGTGIVSISDGTTNFQLGTLRNNGTDMHGQMAYLLSANGGNKTYTLSVNGTETFLDWMILEFSYTGVVSFDTQNTSSGTSFTTTSGNITLDGTGHGLVVGAAGSYNLGIWSNRNINNVAADGTVTGRAYTSAWYSEIDTGTLDADAENTLNDLWTGHIMAFKVPVETGITISGTCRQSDQSTACSDTGGNSVRVAVNGALQAQTDATVDGSWSIASVTQPSANDIVTVFIEGENASSSQAVAVTKYSGSGDIGGLELLEGHLSIGSDQRNTITNANLSQYDSSVSGKKTFYDVNGTVLNADVDSKISREEIYVKNGNTYQPNSSGGDTVNTTSIEINGTFDLDSNVVTASGSWDNNGLFIANTGSVSFTGNGSETVSNTASAGYSGHFYHLKIDSSANTGTLTFSDYDVTASGQMKIETGDTLSIASGRKLTHTGSLLTLNGTISGAGRFAYRSSSAFPTTGTVSSILVYDARDGNQIMSNRTYGGLVEITNNSTTTARTVTMSAGTHSLSGSLNVVASSSQNITLAGAANNPTVNITGDLDYTGSGAGTEIVTTGTGTWTVSGNADFTGGTFTATSGNTLVMNGTSKTLTSASQTLQNLTLSGSITLANATHTIARNLSMAGGTITPGSSTITMSGTNNTITGGGNTLNNLTIDPSSAGTITMQTSNLTVSGTLTVSANDKFRIETGRTLTLSGTGTPLSISGTFEPDDGSTVTYTGSATVTGTTFGNLTLGDGADTITLPSSGTPTIKGNLTIASGATVTAGTSTLLFRAGTTQTITDNNGTKQDLGEIAVRASTSGNTLLTLGSGVKIASVSVDSSQTLDLNGSNALMLTGSDNVFNINGTFVPSTGTVAYTGTSANVGVPSSIYKHLTLGGTGTYVLPSSDLTLRGNLSVTSGATVTKSANNDLIFAIGGGSSQTITDNNGTKQDLGEIRISANTGNTILTLGSGLKISSVSIDASQTLDINGTNTLEITGTGNALTNNGIFQPRTGTVQYSGTSANISGTNYKHLTLGGTGTYTLPSAGTTTILGDLTITSGATVASGSATLFFRAGGTQSVTDNNTTKQNLGEISVMASTSGNTTLNLGSSIRIASASIDPSQTMSLNGSNTLTITGTGNSLTASGSYGTLTSSTGTVVFTGNGATNIPALDYYNLMVQPSADSVTHTFLTGTADITGTITFGDGTNASSITLDTNGTGLNAENIAILANGTLIADDSSAITATGNWTNSGSFTHSSGTVVFAGSNTAQITGATTFNNFTSTVAGKTLRFGAGETFTFDGIFTITGAPDNTIAVRSATPGSQWLADFTLGQNTVTYATITDSGCTGGSSDVILDSTSDRGGNNGSCWVFPPDRHGPGGGPTEGGSGGGTPQTGGTHGGGGENTGSGDPTESGSGGGQGQSGGGQGGGGAGGGGSPPPSPVIFEGWIWAGSLIYI